MCKTLSASLLAAGIAAIALVCCATSTTEALAQAQTAAGAWLEIGGTATPLSLSAADLRAMARTTVRIGGQGGQPAQVYEGVALAELLRRAGVPQGADLGGRWMAAHAVTTGADGYRVTFSLAELNPRIGSTEALVADTLDGRPLAEGQGPLRLIVASDKRAVRWVRAVRTIAIAGCDAGC